MSSLILSIDTTILPIDTTILPIDTTSLPIDTNILPIDTNVLPTTDSVQPSNSSILIESDQIIKDKMLSTQQLIVEKSYDLGDRMKLYENICQFSIPLDQPYLVRLDGNRFSAFTSKLQQPFDDNFIQAMSLTAIDLLKTYHPRTIHFHSDEFSLYFSQSLFNGRIQKIISELASFCAVRFNHHINQLIQKSDNPTYTDEFKQTLSDPKCNFDARVMVFPQRYEFINHMIWRTRDCQRNAISKFASEHYSCKQLHGKNGDEKIQLLGDKGIIWNDIPEYLKSGLICKMDMIHQVTPLGESYQRSHPCLKMAEIKFGEDKTGEDLLKFLFGKYWSDLPNDITATTFNLNYVLT